MKQKLSERAFLSLSKITFGSGWRRWFSPRVLAAVFSVLALQARAAVVFTTLHSFGLLPDGANPQAGLVQGSDGYFYGTTLSGGTNGGAGTVFKISLDGMLTGLYSFTGGDDGSSPGTALVQGADGDFYGTTFGVGTNDTGTISRINSIGFYTNLYVFPDDDGASPNGLVQGTDGYFYGTTEGGRLYGGPGTVFKISTNEISTNGGLYGFTGGNDGRYPRAALAQGSDGSFYGTTVAGGTNGFGTVFKISTNMTLTTLYSFTVNDGSSTQAALVQGSDGYFYGTTSGGGANAFGTAYKVCTNGALTTLYSFTGGNDGEYPQSALVQGSDGNLYGTTFFGGAAGTVFKITTNGVLTTLYSFTGGNDGGSPQSALVQGSDGSFYGTTSGGGENGGGTIFRLTIVPEFQAATLIGDTMSLSWSAERGASYQLQSTSDVASTNWTNVGNPIIANGSTLSLMDPVTNVAQRFYRLSLSP